MWLLVVFFLFDPGQIRYRASVRLSSYFFYLHTTIYTPPNEIPGYAPGSFQFVMQALKHIFQSEFFLQFTGVTLHFKLSAI